VPGHTAEAVARLEAAGYANVGKTNLHEFAYGTRATTRTSAGSRIRAPRGGRPAGRARARRPRSPRTSRNPHNLFHVNQNIAPLGAASKGRP
jgi:Asp-tRNA(Asn)/Glu-tRNA(Gln) amidotransferase A subunit family amidase